MIPKPRNITGKLFRIAVYTSFLIAILSITPIFLAIGSIPISIFPLFVTISFINLFTIWLINILLFRAFEEKKSNNKQHIVRYIFSYIACITFSGLYIIFIDSLNLLDLLSLDGELPAHHEKSAFAPFLMAFFANSFILLMQELFLLREKKTQIELENAQLKVENVKAFNSQLKQQVHPHFLFNSLSVLKSLINKSPEVAEEYLVRLSDFLRVSISSNDANVVKLEDEVKLCKDYLEMQKIRFGSALNFSFNIEEQVLSKGYVPSFSIQILLENAIKHNILTDCTPLNILIEHSQSWVCVKNNMQKKMSLEESTKSGLTNLSERYKIISGNKVKVEESPETFSVSIKILGNEHTNN